MPPQPLRQTLRIGIDILAARQGRQPPIDQCNA